MWGAVDLFGGTEAFEFLPAFAFDCFINLPVIMVAEKVKQKINICMYMFLTRSAHVFVFLSLRMSWN